VGEHLELRHPDDPSRIAALVGPPRERSFPVRLLSEDPGILEGIRRDLELYLLELGGPDPWAYAVYHCETSGNAYSPIRWAHVTGGGES